jgi:hypothetical protein
MGQNRPRERTRGRLGIARRIHPYVSCESIHVVGSQRLHVERPAVEHLHHVPRVKSGHVRRRRIEGAQFWLVSESSGSQPPLAPLHRGLRREPPRAGIAGKVETSVGLADALTRPAEGLASLADACPRRRSSRVGLPHDPTKTNEPRLHRVDPA